MKTKLIIKSSFILLIALVSVCLSVIALKEINKEENNKKEDNSIILDYRILDKSNYCNETLELIYEDENNSYYLPCIKSNLIYIEYNTGEIILLEDALKEININSLIEHGLEVIVESRGEND